MGSEHRPHEQTFEQIKAGLKDDNSGPQMKPVHPGQATLQQDLQTLRDIVRQQHLAREKALQETLQQAAALLEETRQAAGVTALIEELNGLIVKPQSAADPQPFRERLNKAGQTVNQQLQQADDQVAQGLQQAVVSLAQSQAAMLDGQAYGHIKGLIEKCQATLANKWPQKDSNPH